MSKGVSKTLNTLNKAEDYQQWLSSLKQDFQRAQIKATIKVNTTLLEFYWQLGTDILEKQKSTTWGQGFLTQLSQDLMAEFPSIKGFSLRNLKYIRQWVSFYTDKAVGQQAVAQLVQIPWGHNIAIISKCSSSEEAL